RSDHGGHNGHANDDLSPFGPPGSQIAALQEAPHLPPRPPLEFRRPPGGAPPPHPASPPAPRSVGEDNPGPWMPPEMREAAGPGGFPPPPGPVGGPPGAPGVGSPPAMPAPPSPGGPGTDGAPVNPPIEWARSVFDDPDDGDQTGEGTYRRSD